MGQLHIGAIKRSKWALIALVFIFTQFIPLYSLNGIAKAADTGFSTPTATHSPNSWDTATVANIQSSNNVYVNENGGGEQGYSNFNLASIPAGNTIDGILVNIEAKSTDSSGCRVGVALSWNNGTNYTSYKYQNVSGSDATYPVGGSTDTWGRAWSIADFSNTNFVAKIQDDDPGGSCDNTATTSVDYLELKVYYSVTNSNLPSNVVSVASFPFGIKNNSAYTEPGGIPTAQGGFKNGNVGAYVEGACIPTVFEVKNTSANAGNIFLAAVFDHYNAPTVGIDNLEPITYAGTSNPVDTITNLNQLGYPETNLSAATSFKNSSGTTTTASISGRYAGNDTSTTPFVYGSSQFGHYNITLSNVAANQTVYVAFCARLSLDASDYNGSSLSIRTAGAGAENIPIPVNELLKRPSLTITKTVNGGGPAVASDFSFTVSPAIEGISTYSIPSGQSSVTIDNIFPDGQFTITESNYPGYVFDTGSGTNCTFNGSTATATVTAAKNPTNATCNFVNKKQNNPTITVIKKVVNDYGTPAAASDFDVFIKKQDGTYQVNPEDGTATPGKTYTVGTGTFTVGEVTPTNGYEQTGILCTGSGAINGASVTLTYDQSATCTITNTAKQPKIKLNKIVEGNTYGVTPDLNSFGLKIGNTSVNSGQTIGVAANTPYAISENANTPGYEFVRIDGTGCPSTLGGTVSVNVGQTVECTIVNKAKATSLSVTKHAINDNGGTKLAEDFQLYIDSVLLSDARKGGGDVYDSSITYLHSNATDGDHTLVGDYTLSEDATYGYQASDWTCTGNSVPLDDTTVTVKLGEDVRCEITNDDEAPVLTLIKSLNPELYGSGATGSDFTLNATKVGQSVPTVTGQDEDATDATSDVTSGTDFQAGTYNLSESSTTYTEGEEFVSYGWYCTVNGKESTVEVASISLNIGDVATCTIQNEFKPAKLTVVKEVINDNGGNATVGDFDISLTSKGELSFDGGQVNGSKTTYSTQTYDLNAGNYTLSELKSAGYTEGTWDCGTANTSNNALVATDLTLANGASVTCTITNNDIAPSLTVVKNVTNDNGGTATVDAFNIQLNSAALSFGAGVGTTTKTYTATPAVESNKEYSISEVVAGTGYAATDWSCTDNSTGTLLVKVTLDEAESITCTITNDDIAPKLKLTKIVVGDNGSTAVYTDWTVTATGPTTISGAGTVSSGTGFKAGEYTLSESGPTGYDTKGWGCTGGGTLNGDKLTIGLAEDVECTITNDDKAPTLTVIKRVINDNGGNDTVDSFGIKLGDSSLTFSGGTANGANTLKYTATPTVLSNTNYTLSEEGVAGYAEGTWSCSDGSTGNLSVNLNFAVAEDVTCTITNNDIAPSLTVLKTVINDDGGNETVSAFGIKLSNTALGFDGGTVTDTNTTVYASHPTVLANTEYTLSESDIAGYDEGTWSCYDNNTKYKVANPFTLAEAQNVTCEITNDDVAPTLTVIKRIVNNNGGTATPSTFSLKIDSTDLTFGDGNADGSDTLAYTAKPVIKANTEYILSEVLANTGYSGGSWTCTNEATGTLTVNVTLEEGQEVTCTVTNDDIAPSLTLVKKVVNDNGGTAVVADWTLNADGPTALNGTSGVESDESFKAGSYDLTEYSKKWTTDQYDPSSWDCGEANLDGNALSIGLAEDVTCTITNDDIAPTLRIRKNTYTVNETNQVFDFKVVREQGETTETSNVSVPADSTVVVPGAKAGSYSITELLDGIDNWMPVYSYCEPTYIYDEISKFSTQSAYENPTATTKLGLGEDITCYFGNEELSTVSVLKYNDKNENGIRDTYFNRGLEPVMAGIQFKLYDGEKTISATTNEQGIATFSNIRADWYIIYESFDEGENWKITQFDCTGQERDIYDRSSNFQTLTQEYAGEHIYVSPGATVECTVGNASDNYYYDIAKSNNAPTAKRVGDVVTYTITLTIPEDTGVLHNPRVGDAPPTGFKYLSGSWTASSNLRGNLKPGVSVEPTYASPGVWRFNGFDTWYDEDESVTNNAFYPGEVITLTYQTKIESNVTPGTYPDKALSIAFNTSDIEDQNKDTVVIANVQEEDDSPFVGTQVVVVTDTIPPTLVNTGSSALWALLMGAGLIIAGIATRRITATERRMK